EPRSQKTFAELDEDAKNSVSHRGRALAALAREIRNRGLL
ncbi:MAG TPA: non-canonical purine NTP pyrophosphatase, partial [Deltaproteobacteria bacterium]|nr:non-canonical purine NTP pyrophosphatase [Deltaproteobacteria bacterium]